MWTKTLIVGLFALICFACVILGTYLAGYRKGKKQEIGALSIGLLTMEGFLLSITILILWVGICITVVRQRLNEPITSEMQLYGYRILDKREIKERPSVNAPEESKYVIDIFDLLSTHCGLFTDVEVSEEIFPKLIKGKSYVPESELNELMPQEPNKPSNQKAETEVSAFFIF